MIPTPSYLEKGVSGVKSCDIFSKLLSNRIIMLFDNIDRNTACIVISQLLFLEAVDPEKDITLYINSPGGSVNDGLAIYDTIKANCNVEIFLGSQSYRTKREFSEKCGTRRIKTLDAALSPDKRTIMEIPVLSINSLENLAQGDAYVKRLNRPNSKTHFEMAYMCSELSHNKLSAKELGINSIPYNDEIFVYKYLENEHPMATHGKINKGEKIKEPFFVDM